METKLVIFDMFGVLVNIDWGNLEEFLKENEVKIKVDSFNKAFKETFQISSYGDIKEGIKVLAKRIGEEKNLKFKNAQLDFFKNFQERINVNEKSILLLRFLKKLGYKLAILSNSFQIESEVFKNLGLTMIDKIFLSSETKILKPNKDAFLNVCKYFNLTPQECLMVGDNYDKDIKPAEELGMKTILWKEI